MSLGNIVNTFKSIMSANIQPIILKCSPYLIIMSSLSLFRNEKSLENRFGINNNFLLHEKGLKYSGINRGLTS